MRTSLTLAILLACLSAAFPQNGWIRTGIKACRTGDYLVAIEALTKALEHKGMLSDRQIPKAYYYRAHARLMLLCNQDALPPGAHLKAFNDLREAAALTERGKYATRIREDRKLLFDLLLEESLRKIDSGQRNDLSLSQREITYREALGLLETAARIDGDHYLLHDLKAQVYLGLKDYEQALKAFRKATRSFQQRPPDRPDLLFAYAFYRQALIHYHYRYQEDSLDQPPAKYDMDLALEAVRQGIEMLEGEFRRGQDDRRLTLREKAVSEARYREILLDLNNLQLDLYLQAPDRYNEALRIFAEVVEGNPKEYLYYIAYGQLLELSDRQRAADVYETAAGLTPHRPEAHFNLGAMYLNQAARLIEQAHREERVKLYAQRMREARELLKKARPHFEKAHRIDPANLQVLNALMQICVLLEDEQGYRSYRSAKVELLTR